jgi:hypothetical protein
MRRTIGEGRRRADPVEKDNEVLGVAAAVAYLRLE